MSHVSVDSDGARATGMWVFSNPCREDLVGRLAHWIVVGTRDGITRAEAVLGEQVGSADLAGLVASAQSVQSELEATWEQYQAAEPKKRANLVPLAAPSWPKITDDGDAADYLRRIGHKPYPESTPDDVRDCLALTRLVTYVLSCWAELEDERLARPYLREPESARRLMPHDWMTANPTWWPGVA